MCVCAHKCMFVCMFVCMLCVYRSNGLVLRVVILFQLPLLLFPPLFHIIKIVVVVVVVVGVMNEGGVEGRREE